MAPTQDGLALEAVKLNLLSVFLYVETDLLSDQKFVMTVSLMILDVTLLVPES